MRSFFERKKNQMKRQRINAPTNIVFYSLQQTTPASYFVTWRIEKQKKPHIIGEEFVKSAAVHMVRNVCGILTNYTIRALIYDMSNDMKHQVTAPIKTSGQWCLQFDESTDISDDGMRSLSRSLTCIHFYWPFKFKRLYCCVMRGI